MNRLTFFSRLRNSRTKRIICAFLAINLIAEVVSPSVALALTSGPSSPEFSSFEPVATTDMVNDFSGDFTYNIPVLNVPGPDGAGYSMSLAYHSGSSCEEEASWVGFGWTLNPGAINRNKNGYPDEFNGVEVEKFNKQKPSWNQSAKFDLNLEYSSQDQKEQKDQKAKNKAAGKATKIFSGIGKGPTGSGNQPNEDPADISLSISHSIRYNNYTGFSIANGFGVGVKGMANLNMNRSGGQNTFGFSVSPMAIMKSLTKTKRKEMKDKGKKHFVDKISSSMSLWSTKNKKDQKTDGSIRPGLLSNYSFKISNAPALSYSVAKNAGASWNFSASVELNVNIPVGIQIGVAGSMDIQAQEGKQTKSAYGYLYSGAAQNSGTNSYADEKPVFDYQIEKESTFSKHDKNLGIPFSSPDVFSATGNNVVGGFKLYHNEIGSFYPEYVENVMKMRQLGVELGIGATIQIGFDIGIGKQKTEIQGKWPKMPEDVNDIPTFSAASSSKMRFTGDLGGEIKYGNYGGIENAVVGSNHRLDLDGIETKIDQKLIGNSSYINYTQSANTTNPSIEKIEITNKDGGKAIYGTAIYTKNETELSIGLNTNQDGQYIVSHPLNIGDPMANKSAVGQKTAAKYASAYLLTANTTFNYVDADGDGKYSNEDFGGWTKFDYRKVYGDNSVNGTWYRYRSPYVGLNYNRGRMLETDDQTGSMSSGEKEVAYLKCIETKSHIAFFVTNKTTISDFSYNEYPFLYNGSSSNPLTSVASVISGSGVERFDGVDAEAVTTTMDPAASSLSAKGLNTLEKLERIVLFAKSDLSKPLTTTFFEYDYSLVQGIPNTKALPSAPAKDKGKLTLKKVWTESGGVNTSKISPYQFHYEYFQQYPQNIKDLYPTWANKTYLANDPKQNPYYKPEHLDIWGNYQLKGAERFANEQHWLSQKTDPDFDPAVWQLKRIQLPSGGEIHVQYEQKDYTSVQDRTPMAMVSLLSDSNKDGYKSDESVFCINTDDIEVSSISTYSASLYNYFVTEKNKLYFKVLYTYTGDDEPSINTGSYRYDYVTGYVSVNDVVQDNGKIFLHLGDTRDNGNGKKDKTLPRYVCYQEALTNGGKNLGINSRGYVNDDDLYTGIAYDNNAELDPQDFTDMARQHVLSNTLDMFADWIDGNVKNVKKADACKHINFPLSYFKLPVYNAKKGGGIRVKRLLTYDPGISGESNGDAMVYGTEYSYINEDGTSSGVATNEPGQGREENALVGYLERKKQKWLDKITNGRDTKQFEGPLGESIMPSASVGHSRIVIKNIHSGKTTTGYVVNKYNTAKDYPFDVEFSDLSKKDGTYKKLNLSIPLGLFNLDIHRAWVTQGYLFKLNDMHGKIASKATYAGNYNFSDFKESAFTSKTSYNYSTPGTSIPSMTYDRDHDQFTSQMLNPGTEEDLTMFTANVHEKSNNFSVEIDLNLSFYPLSCSVGFGLSYSFADQLLCQHVTSKVINQVSYLLSTTNVTDGVTQTTENLAFDKNTGDPVLTRTFDGYMAPNEKMYTQGVTSQPHDGYYYSFNIPASWMYPSMGSKTSELSGNSNQLSAVAGNVVTYGTNEMYEKLANRTVTTNTALSAYHTFSWSPTAEPLVNNIVSASATTYTNNWFSESYINTEFPLSSNGVYDPTVIDKLNSFYYPVKTYAYRENVTNANSGSKIYNGGITNAPFLFFNWNPPTNSTVSDKWYSDGTITQYSPFGYPVEETDVLGIKSSAKFGYGNTLPVSVVQNAKYVETKFIDFEYGFVAATTGTVTNQFAHSGRCSFDLSQTHNYVFVKNYPISSDMISKKGVSVKFWLRSSLSEVPSSTNYKLKNPNPQPKVVIGSQPFDCKFIAQTGEWSLYSAEIKNFNGVLPGDYNIKISYNYASSSETVFVDDFRIQPLDASMNCSVYTADNKVAAQFDDQHFGVFYEYNNKGQLVRKSIETERGKKVLQEQQYNTPQINRN